MSKICALIGLGSNLGDREQNIRQAIDRISEQIGDIEACSSLHETAPWGFQTKHPFVNAVIQVQTELDAMQLLEISTRIEQKMGRTSKTSQSYEDRLIDIDLLDFNGLIINTKELTLPHPKMHLRNFVLIPLSEILPIWIHPVFRTGISELQNRFIKGENSIH